MISSGPGRAPLLVPPPIDLPAHWWGPFGRRPDPLTIQQLVANETIDRNLAAWLWLLIEAGASTLVCAGPGGAGKTTLLTALTAFLAPHRTPYVVRGAFDPLEAIADRPPAETALLSNELSAHLPIYVWGAGARRVFDAGRSGAQLLATAHATTLHEMTRELAAPPIHATDEDLRLWDLVIFVDAWWQGARVVRRVAGVISCSLDTPARTLAAANPEGKIFPDPSQMLRLARRFGYSGATIEAEFVRRTRALDLVP